MCKPTRLVCALHNCIQNNMEHKEKGICTGGENMVKCATVRPLIYSVFYFTMTAQNSRIGVGSRLYLYLYSFVKIGD